MVKGKKNLKNWISMIQMKENTNTLSKIHKNILYFNLLIDYLKEPSL